jgi:hypothetical protein
MNILFAGSAEAYTEITRKTGSKQLPCLFFAADLNSMADLGKPEYDQVSACLMPIQHFIELKTADAACIPAMPLLVSGPVDGMDESFNLGCADYLVEPWSSEELQARCRRCASLPCGTLHFLSGSNSLQGKQERCRLNLSEARILRLLLANRGAGCSRLALADTLQVKSAGRALDMRISRLRNKLRRCDPANNLTIARQGKNLYQLIIPPV